MTPDLASFAGWIGMLLLLGAYWKRGSLTSYRYALLNLGGAVLLAVHCAIAAAWPAMALQFAWAAIAVGDMARPANPTARH